MCVHVEGMIDPGHKELHDCSKVVILKLGKGVVVVPTPGIKLLENCILYLYAG